MAAPAQLSRLQTGPHQSSGFATDSGSKSRNGANSNGKASDGKNGDGKNGDGKNGDGKNGDRKNGDGKNRGPGAIDPGAVQASVSAASQRAITKALADAKLLNSRVRAELARLFGRTSGPGVTTPVTPRAAATGGAAATGTVPSDGSDGARVVSGRSTAGHHVSAEGGPAAPASSAPAPRSTAHRGAEPLALQLGPPGDSVVTALFGFVVLGALWTLWMASLRPVLGRRAPARGNRAARDVDSAPRAPFRRGGAHRR